MEVSEFKARIKSRPERTVDICLDPATYAEWEAAEERLREARGRSTTINGDPAIPALARAVRDLEDAMQDATVQFRFRALTRREWADLVAQHPPKDGDRVGRQVGYDIDGATVDAARLCLVEPELDDEDWDALDESLSAGQWELVKNTVLAVNAGKVEVPFSQLASRLTADSDAT